jgi:hypothetical protein
VFENVIVLPQQSFVFGSFSLATTSSQWMLFLLVGFLYQALFTVPLLEKSNSFLVILESQ